MSVYQVAYRADADGYVARYAGQRIGRTWDTHAEAEEIRRACPNGAQMEIVEVER